MQKIRLFSTICDTFGNIIIKDNGVVSFSENFTRSAAYSAFGGAIFSSVGSISLLDNLEVNITKNYATSPHGNNAHGGALYSGASINIQGTDIANITNNYSLSSCSTDNSALGGAIYGDGEISIINNNVLSFIDNHTESHASAALADAYVYSSQGGAIFSTDDLIISCNKNVAFEGNNSVVAFDHSATSKSSFHAQGGAIYSSGELVICNNGIVKMSRNGVSYQGNSASSNAAYYIQGGAIYSSGHIAITGNEGVVFEKNYEISGVGPSKRYRLRSIYMDPSSSNHILELSAKDASTITFYDSVCMENYAGSQARFNADFVDNNGVTQNATGDIIFSGEYTEAHLSEIKGSTPTTSEIDNSRTSYIYNPIYLHGGRLMVVDGAILNGHGITLSQNSNAQLFLRNASMYHGDFYNFTFNRGTSLVLQGVNAIETSQLILHDESNLVIYLDDCHLNASALSLSGTLNIKGALSLTLDLSSDKLLDGESYQLLHVSAYNPTQWTDNTINVVSAEGTAIDFSNLEWKNNVLYLKFSDSMSMAPLLVATWTNDALDGLWNFDSLNWAQDSYDYAYVDGVAVVFGDTGAGEVKIVGDLTPSSVLVDSSADYTWFGDGCICGATTLTKQGIGTLAINNANSYTGGTLIYDGKVVVGIAGALGSGEVSVNGGALEIGVNGFTNEMSFVGNSGLIIGGGVTYALQGALSNGGVLTLAGSFNADALSPSETIAATRVDLNGNTGASGFARAEGYTLQVVNGGTVNDDAASITYNGTTISLDDNGKATVGGVVQYSQYHIASGHTASVSVISAKSSSMGSTLGNISLAAGGTLNANATTNVNATGGTIKLTAGTLSGSLQNVNMTASGGAIAGAFSGSSTLTGSDYALASALQNNGALTLVGSFNADALAPSGTIAATRVDLDGNTGASGFAQSAGFTLQVVNGGTVNDDAATITYNGTTITLDNTGKATVAGGIQYNQYHIASGHIASVSAISSKASSMGSTLGNISLAAGGTLNANATANVTATGGTIKLTAGTLSGTLQNVNMTASGGAINGTFSGSSTLTGSNYALVSALKNNGSLTLKGSFKADALSKELTGVDVRVDVNGNEGGTSGFLRTGDFTVTLANGSVNSSNASVSYKGQALSMNGGVGFGKGTVDYGNYLLTDGNSASVSDILDAANGALEDITMTGGNLAVDDSVVLDATGGNITITDDSTLSGSIVDTDITTAEGEYESSIDAVIGGDSPLTVNGGTITVTGDNTYTGGTIINGGMLNIGSDTSLGAGDVTLNGGTLDLNSFAVQNNVLASGGSLSGADNFGGKLTVNGDLTLEGETTAAGGIELNGGSISGGSIEDSDILVDGEGDMEISSDITGDSSLTVNGGNLTISGGNNNYTGGTTINGGNLTIGEGGSLGSGEVTLNGGTLDTNGGEITNDIINNGGTLITSYVLSEGLTMTVGKGGMQMVGNLTLSGGNLRFVGLPLTVDGKVDSTAAVNVFVSGYGVIDMDGTVTLANFGTNVQGVTVNSFVNTGYGTLSYDDEKHTLNLTLTEKNIWVGGKGSSWVQGLNVGWQNYETFEAGNRVVFNTKGTVKIVGGVEPASVLVDVEKALTFSTSYNKKTGLYSGAIIGDGCVVKRGKGTLTMNDGNEYTGGTFIEAGTVKAKGATSFGTGDITLLGGAVDLSSKAVANDIVLEGTAAVNGGKKYTGEFTMTGGELLKGSLINVADSAELQGGVVNGTLSGVGTVAVSGNVTLGSSGKITTNALEVDGSLTVAKTLAMNSKASAITIAGGTLSSAGKISAYSLSMEGGKLDVTNGKPMGITLKGGFSATKDADIDLYGGLTATS